MINSLLPAAALCLFVAVLASPVAALGAEGYRLRQTPIGSLGADLGSWPDTPGFFGNATFSATQIRGVVGPDGKPVTLEARTLALPTAAPTGGAVPNGRFSLQVPPGSWDVRQSQVQLGLTGGYATEPVYGGGALVLRASLPLIQQHRSFQASQPAGAIVPAIAPSLPAPAANAVNAVASAANAQLQASLDALNASQNKDVFGAGDLELSAAWTRTQERLRIGAGLNVYLPTGSYDPSRGPNPGYGRMRTAIAGVGASYAFGSPGAAAGPGGPTLAARATYGTNTRNRDTDYRSGDFASAEVAVSKPFGNWGLGANLLSLRQLEDDTRGGSPVALSRYRSNAAGAFVMYKLPGRDAAVSLQWSQTFGERNAFVSRTLQLRLVSLRG